AVVQVQVPSLRSRQVLVKAWPGRTTVPSGMVTSCTKVARSVQPVGGAVGSTGICVGVGASVTITGSSVGVLSGGVGDASAVGSGVSVICATGVMSGCRRLSLTSAKDVAAVLSASTPIITITAIFL